MKKNTLLIVALAAAGVYLFTRRGAARPRGSVFVPEPEKISEGEYLDMLRREREAAEKAAKRQRALDIARKAAELAKRLAEKRIAQKQTRSLGTFF